MGTATGFKKKQRGCGQLVYRVWRVGVAAVWMMADGLLVASEGLLQCGL